MGPSRPDLGRCRHKEGAEHHGCVLAHAMGLGKTLTIIAFLHTALKRALAPSGLPYVQATASAPDAVSLPSSPPTALVLVPKSVASQWEQEFSKWLTDEMGNHVGGGPSLKCFRLDAEGRSAVHRAARLSQLRRWRAEGGVMIVVHDTFRSILTSRTVAGSQFAAAAAAAAVGPSAAPESAPAISLDAEFRSLLLWPGADILVVDEAHVLKNEHNQLSKVLSQVLGVRRCGDGPRRRVTERQTSGNGGRGNTRRDGRSARRGGLPLAPARPC